MNSFTSYKDPADLATGTEWRLRLTVWHVSETLRTTNVNIAMDDAKWVEEFHLHPQKLVDALWVLIADQAAAAGLTPADVGKQMDGPAVGAAIDALSEEILRFFQRGRVPALHGSNGDASQSTDSSSPTNAPDSLAATHTLTPSESS